jgi:hypothetical protein
VAIQPYPVWPFLPNWTEPVGERVEWLTDILVSESGAEQRRSLRIFPRQMMDFQLLVSGAERAYFDNFLTAFGSSRIYMPVWYHVAILEEQALQGAGALTIPNSGFAVGNILFIFDSEVGTFELVEVQAVDSDTVSLIGTLTKNWSAGARVCPVGSGRLVEQPSIVLRSDRLSTTDIQFQFVDKPNQSDAAVLDYSVVRANAEIDYVYNGFPVLTKVPEFATDPRRTYVRNIDLLDNEISLPIWVDETERSFTTLEIGRYLKGRVQHSDFMRFLQVLRGRAVPVWVPTFGQDLILTADVTAGADIIDVEFTGYTRTGGIKPDRAHVMIETLTHHYFRQVLSTQEIGINERIRFTNTLPGIAATEIVRICFMSLMRLDHDSVEISHHADNTGLSQATLRFRSAPNTRQPLPAF